MKHGTAGGYARGCRCEDCRHGHREYAKTPKIRMRENERRRVKNAARSPEQIETDRERERARYRTKRRPQMLAARRRSAYGIEPEQFATLLALQSSRCAICRTDKPNGRGDWHVDHDHQTGRIRGLLCHSCNVALGLFGDSEARLIAALNYLRREPE